jgi:hypothetical protein
MPGSRVFAASWTDTSGNLWLLGGLGYDSVASDGNGYLNDLWKYAPSTGSWTWVGGSNANSSNLNPDTVNGANGVPGGRYGATTWVDQTGTFWLYGGMGLNDGTGAPVGAQVDYLSDLWAFNPSTGVWTHVSGTLAGGSGSSYGVLGTPATTNQPSGRQYAVSWVDHSGNLWLFGGKGYDSVKTAGGDLSDLWEFTPNSTRTSGVWTWVGGSGVANSSGVYGTPGTADAGNMPGARQQAVSWTDPSGNFWMFGGGGSAAAGQANGTLNDLWEFNPTTGQWTWQSGANFAQQAGVYGTPGSADSANHPGARISGVAWADSQGRLWLFGGNGLDSTGAAGDLNDLWMYSGGQWTWVSGTNVADSKGSYQAAPYMPAGHYAAVSWIDPLNRLWLFGGYSTILGYGVGSPANDLWMYTP